MNFKKGFSVVIILIISMFVSVSPILTLAENDTAEPSSSPNVTSESVESGTTRGVSASPKPSASSRDNAELADEKSTATPNPTRNPRIDESGLPILAEEECAILVNTLDGEIMFEQNSNERVYPASTTKIMTALLVIEAIDRGEVNLNSAFLITDDMLEDLDKDGSSMKLKVGEAMTVEYLLEGLLVESGNDAGQALAIIVCGDVSTFVERMNHKAEELGLNGTHFQNPHGLDEEGHYTTAADLCNLTQVAMQNKAFRDIVSMSQAIIPETEMSDRRAFVNTNGLISTLKYPNYYYSYATGVKTGHTSKAGYCLVSSAQKGDLEVIAVMMNCKTEDDRHYNSRNLLAYAIDNYKAETAIKKGDLISEIKVKFGSGTGHTTLSTNGDIIVTIPDNADPDELEVVPEVPAYALAPVTQGEILGTVNVLYDGKVVGSGSLCADTSIKRHPLGFLMQFFSYIWSFWFVKIIVILLLIFIIIFIAYMIINIKKNIKTAKRRRRSSRSKRY